MKIQNISKQNFGINILSEKIKDTLQYEKDSIEYYWGIDSPQYDYVFQTHEKIDEYFPNAGLDLIEKKNSFSLSFIQDDLKKPIIKTYKNKNLNAKLILDFLIDIKRMMMRK